MRILSRARKLIQARAGKCSVLRKVSALTAARNRDDRALTGARPPGPPRFTSATRTAQARPSTSGLRAPCAPLPPHPQTPHPQTPRHCSRHVLSLRCVQILPSCEITHQLPAHRSRIMPLSARGWDRGGVSVMVEVLGSAGWPAVQWRPERAPSPVRAPITGRKPGRRVAAGDWLRWVAEVARGRGSAALPAVVPAGARDLTGRASLRQAPSPTQFRAARPGRFAPGLPWWPSGERARYALSTLCRWRCW